MSNIKPFVYDTMTEITAAFAQLTDLFDVFVAIAVTVTLFTVGRRWLARA